MGSAILVAEDQPDIRDLIALNLRQAGYDVTPVADGRAALDSQADRSSDLLFVTLTEVEVPAKNAAGEQQRTKHADD